MLPRLSAEYGIHPWQVPLLTYGEIEEYLARLREADRARAKSERESRRRRG